MTSIPRLDTLLKYRADVDGLRALAVLSVVAYHLEFPLHGGYVGVDIFFTISGFLIGSIILRETEADRFTFAGFYERRIRRIFPALFAMLFLSCVLAYEFLFPTELTAFAKSLVAVAFSVSNGFFWLQSGYFDAPASTTPLLHTWSLAVEEQFYFFLPVFLVLLRRFAPRRVDFGIYAVAAVSFVISIYGAYKFPTATFFLPHTRAWELLLGTILALRSCPKFRGQISRQTAAIAGLLLIAGALLFYSPSTPFPGLAALPPCLGTALIIAAGESGTTVVGRMFSLKPIAFIGLISYSLYLWHWPVIVFYKLGFTVLAGLDHHQSQALQLTLSLALAVLSWRCVEIPFRGGTMRMKRSALFTSAAAASLVIVLLSGTSWASQGFPSRFTPKALGIAAFIADDPVGAKEQYRTGTCFITSDNAVHADYKADTCLPEKPGQRTLLVLGDSHAAAMWWGLARTFPDTNVMQATATGCKPVLIQRPRQHRDCSEIMDYIFKSYLPTHRVDSVLIEAHWDSGDISSLNDTIARLRQQHIPVIVCGPIVQYDSSLPRLLAMSISDQDGQLPRRHLAAFVEPLDNQMAILAHDRWDVPYVSMFHLFCAKDACTQYAAPGVPLQSDYGHLTKAGSVLAARRIAALGVLPIGVQ